MHKTLWKSVEDLDLDNIRDKKIVQWSALAGSLSGDGFESFINSNESAQSDLLWLVSDLACEVKEINDEMNHRRHTKVVAHDQA